MVKTRWRWFLWSNLKDIFVEPQQDVDVFDFFKMFREYFLKYVHGTIMNQNEEKWKPSIFLMSEGLGELMELSENTVF